MIRELDENGDIKAGTFLTGKAAVGLRIECRVQQWKGENAFDLDEGIDWKNELPIVVEERLRTQIRDIVMTTPGVKYLKEEITFEQLPEKREVIVFISVVTIFDNNPINIEV